MIGNYLHAGITEVETQDRSDFYTTGVPAQGGGLAVMDAPSGSGCRVGLSRVDVKNIGAVAVHARLRHGGGVKAIVNERLTALAVSALRYGGKLQYGKLVPGSVVITETGGQVIVDDGNGVLHDSGIPANVRGSIKYAAGTFDVTFGGAVTEPVYASFNCEDFQDFASAAQIQAAVGGAAPVAFQTTYGRVNPSGFSATDGAKTFVDDGKGHIIETTGGISVVAGSINYATGAGVFTVAVANPVTLTYTFNPFAGVVVPGAGNKLFDLIPGQIPELTVAPWARGIIGEAKVAIWAETASNMGGSLIAQWWHYGEDLFRVNALYSGFLPGGVSNAEA